MPTRLRANMATSGRAMRTTLTAMTMMSSTLTTVTTERKPRSIVELSLGWCRRAAKRSRTGYEMLAQCLGGRAVGRARGGGTYRHLPFVEGGMAGHYTPGARRHGGGIVL
ncbi:unnamed protein product [Ectocarpus fasciculatus]